MESPQIFNFINKMKPLFLKAKLRLGKTDDYVSFIDLI